MSATIDRVHRALSGAPVETIPAGFWYHFPQEAAHGTAAVEAHVKYFRETGMDFVKIMNENEHPCARRVDHVGDWRAFRPMELTGPGMRDQLDIIRRVTERLGDQGVVLVTVYGVVNSAIHASGRDQQELKWELPGHLRQEPRLMRSVFGAIADSASAFAAACVEAGAGVYYSAVGGERGLFTDEEFAEVIAPADRQVLAAAEAADPAGSHVLHVCGNDIALERYRPYRPGIVSWSTVGCDTDLTRARELFPDSTLLGGVGNALPQFTGGSAADAAALVTAALDGVDDHRRLIVGADCSLPGTTPIEHIRAMVEAAHSYVPRNQGTSGAGE